MEKNILGLCLATAVASAATAAPLATESFSNAPATLNSGVPTVSPDPGFTLAGAPDIDAAGQFNTSYEYGPAFVSRIADNSLKFPGAADDNFLLNQGNADHFFRVFANTAVANTSPNFRTAFAFNIAERSGTAADNDVDLWRFLDIARTGSGASIATVQIEDGDILLSTNGLGGTVVGNISSLVDNRWYVFVLDYNRAAAAAGSANSYIIDSTTGTTTTLTPLTGLTAANLNDFATLATGATLAAPSGTASFKVRLDTVAIFSSAIDAPTLETEVRNFFTLPSSVNDWSMF